MRKTLSLCLFVALGLPLGACGVDAPSPTDPSDPVPALPGTRSAEWSCHAERRCAGEAPDVSELVGYGPSERAVEEELADAIESVACDGALSVRVHCSPVE